MILNVLKIIFEHFGKDDYYMQLLKNLQRLWVIVLEYLDIENLAINSD